MWVEEQRGPAAAWALRGMGKTGVAGEEEKVTRTLAQWSSRPQKLAQELFRKQTSSCY